jgi:hypothetical protein
MCFDAYPNDTYALFDKDTTIIRYRVSDGYYDTQDNLLSGKTKGKLMMAGLYSITNSPSTA